MSNYVYKHSLHTYIPTHFNLRLDSCTFANEILWPHAMPIACFNSHQDDKSNYIIVVKWVIIINTQMFRKSKALLVLMAIVHL
jgi:hypothetical protein